MFLLPNILGFLLFSSIPVLATFSISLLDWDLIRAPQFVGLDNYIKLLPDDALFRKVLLASASMPGYFPPVPIDVVIDGKPAEELHVDGGVTASLFFRSPHASPPARHSGRR